MGFATYAELKTAVGSHLARSDLTSAIPDLITLAEAYLKTEPRLHVRDAEASTTLTPTDGVCTLPSDFGAARLVYASELPLQLATPEWCLEKYYEAASSAYPKHYTIVGSNLTTYPASTGNVTLVYYKKLTALSDSNTTNWLLTAHPHVYLYATLIQAEPYLKNDARITIWASLLGKALDQIKGFDDLARYSGARARVKGNTP